MRVSEIKTECKLAINGQTLDAMIHLIEVRYSDRIVFWNAVWQLADDELAKLGDAPIKEIGVWLPDGRDGFLVETHGRFASGYVEMAGVGKPNSTQSPQAAAEEQKAEPSGLLEGNKSVLKFRLLTESVNILAQEGNSPWRLMNKLNNKPWRGKERGSCRVIDIRQTEAVPAGRMAMMDHAEFIVLVGYRPEGWISGVKNRGRDRLNGWHLEVRDQMYDGTLLDGHGKPLPPGAEPVFLRFEVCEYEDFNDCEFGHFLGEE